ncbi:MAG: DUF402 domain-containing protein [Candidatus Cloacimonetes bacterium]|nr:DUF402 domain-containing protein [Candidatus Cloacimonadota bacterium]
MSAGRVIIHYHRPPDRYERFEQHLVHRTHDCVVTLLDAASVSRDIVIDGVTALEPGASVVWFTFRDAWHDIGRFHTRDDSFTGFYANVLTPVEGFDGTEWRTTDLYLDIWQPADGPPRILDQDELADARRAGAVDEASAQRAEREASALLHAAQAGAWPPPIVLDWTLERARRHVHWQRGVR